MVDEISTRTHPGDRGVATLAACSSITTSADYDKSANFSEYKTYAWKDTDQKQNELVENRIKAAVDSQLQAKGLHEVDSNPDLWVVEHVRALRADADQHLRLGLGLRVGLARRLRRRGHVATTVQTIPVGNLIVDLVDAKESQLKWRGTASKTLDRERERGREDQARQRGGREDVRGVPAEVTAAVSRVRARRAGAARPSGSGSPRGTSPASCG